ncbi:MAG: DUF309 domain-containing protein [Sulfitobacter sp.]|nr:DUF309 domain-containing protein [Sulfitobacter sp.]
MPPYAYVPGQNARHPEDWFDQIKGSVTSGMSASALAQTQAFQAGLAYLKAGYFWECHEVLEAVWLQTPQETPEREMVQAFIQLANAQLKVRMNRPKAARRLCGIVQDHLQHLSGKGAILGQRPEDVQMILDEVRITLQ